MLETWASPRRRPGFCRAVRWEALGSPLAGRSDDASLSVLFSVRFATKLGIYQRQLKLDADFGVVASTILLSPAFAHDNQRWDDDDRGHHVHGAPGPIAGAGLPVLAVGFGVYRLTRRRRGKAE
jgi:hypothetical protein